MGQAMVERGDPWPFDEWSHGIEGQLEYYREVFGTDNLGHVRKYLEYMIAKKVKGHWECPCGSGRRIRDCHSQQIYSLRMRMPRTDAHVALNRLARVKQVLGKGV